MDEGRVTWSRQVHWEPPPPQQQQHDHSVAVDHSPTRVGGGLLWPPWGSPAHPSEEPSPGGVLPPSLPAAAAWRRPSHIFADKRPVLFYDGGGGETRVLAKSLEVVARGGLAAAFARALAMLEMVSDAATWTPSAHLCPWEYPFKAGATKRKFYAVRLFFLGCWRRLVVDECIPVDIQGSVILPGAEPPHVLWPYYLFKALTLLASLSWSWGDETRDFSVIECLSGYLSERIPLTAGGAQLQWAIIKEHLAEMGRYQDDTEQDLNSVSEVKCTHRKGSKIISDAFSIEGSFMLAVVKENGGECRFLLVLEGRRLDTECTSTLEPWRKVRWVDWARRHSVPFFEKKEYCVLKLEGVLSESKKLNDSSYSLYSTCMDTTPKSRSESARGSRLNYESEKHCKVSETMTTTWVSLDDISPILHYIEVLRMPLAFNYSCTISDLPIRHFINVKGIEDDAYSRQELEGFYHYQNETESEPVFLYLDSENAKNVVFHLSVMPASVAKARRGEGESAAGSLLMEQFRWWDESASPPLCVLRSGARAAGRVRAGEGRFVLRLWLTTRACAGFVLRCFSDSRETLVAAKEEVMRRMGKDSVRVLAFGAAVRSVFTSVAMHFGRPEAVEAARNFRNTLQTATKDSSQALRGERSHAARVREEAAARVLQNFFRRVAQRVTEERRLQGVELTPRRPRRAMRRLADIMCEPEALWHVLGSPSLADLLCFSRDFLFTVRLREWSAAGAAGGPWGAVFRAELRARGPSRVSPSVACDALPPNSLVVRLLDNDRPQEESDAPHSRGVQLASLQLTPNERGYTIFAYVPDSADSPCQSRMVCLWRMRLCTPRPGDELVNARIASLLFSSLQETYVPRGCGLIGRCLLRTRQRGAVVSLRFSVSCPSARFHLRVEDPSGITLIEAEGVHTLVLPAVVLETQGKKETPKKEKNEEKSVSPGGDVFAVEARVVGDSWPLTDDEWKRAEAVALTTPRDKRAVFHLGLDGRVMKHSKNRLSATSRISLRTTASRPPSCVRTRRSPSHTTNLAAAVRSPSASRAPSPPESTVGGPQTGRRRRRPPTSARPSSRQSTSLNSISEGSLCTMGAGVMGGLQNARGRSASLGLGEAPDTTPWWRLQVAADAGDRVEVALDCSLKEKTTLIQQELEKTDPGRAERARAARETFLKKLRKWDKLDGNDKEKDQDAEVKPQSTTAPKSSPQLQPSATGGWSLLNPPTAPKSSQPPPENSFNLVVQARTIRQKLMEASSRKPDGEVVRPWSTPNTKRAPPVRRRTVPKSALWPEPPPKPANAGLEIVPLTPSTAATTEDSSTSTATLPASAASTSIATENSPSLHQPLRTTSKTRHVPSAANSTKRKKRVPSLKVKESNVS